MRFRIVALTACASICLAQRPEDAVLSVYRQMEKAEQTGDGDAWFALWSAKSDTAAHPEMKAMVRPRADARYQSTAVLVDGDRAALIGSIRRQFLNVRFIREGGVWKILDQEYSNVPYDPAVLYALVPPAPGAFEQAGSPWNSVPLAGNLRAIRDEAYLHVRIESARELPALDTEVTGSFPNLRSPVSRDWPIMKIRVLGPPTRDIRFDAGDAIGDRAKFGEDGKATSHLHFVTYSLLVTRGDQTLFNVSAGKSPLISVHDRFVDLKFPLKALGAAGRMQIVDANVPGSFPPYEAKAFTR